MADAGGAVAAEAGVAAAAAAAAGGELFTRGGPNTPDTRGQSMVAKHIERQQKEKEHKALEKLKLLMPQVVCWTMHGQCTPRSESPLLPPQVHPPPISSHKTAGTCSARHGTAGVRLE